MSLALSFAVLFTLASRSLVLALVAASFTLGFLTLSPATVVAVAGTSLGDPSVLALVLAVGVIPLIGGVMEGAATDLSIEAQEILRLRELLYGILAKHSGTAMSKIQKDCDRNLWLSPSEAREYGLVDRILERQPDLKHPSSERDE